MNTLHVLCLFLFIRPKRYFLGDLVDWLFAVMRKDSKWGYFRYDMRFDPIFLAKTWFTQNISPGWPVGILHFEGLELVRALNSTDSDLYCVCGARVALCAHPTHSVIYYTMCNESYFFSLAILCL
jgi:hypothetical protein